MRGAHTTGTRFLTPSRASLEAIVEANWSVGSKQDTVDLAATISEIVGITVSEARVANALARVRDRNRITLAKAG